MTEIKVETTIITEECITCGAVFAIPAALQRQLKQNGALFYCPNGHGQHYTNTIIQQKDAEIKRLNDKNFVLQNVIDSKDRELKSCHRKREKLQKKLDESQKNTASEE